MTLQDTSAASALMVATSSQLVATPPATPSPTAPLPTASPTATATSTSTTPALSPTVTPTNTPSPEPTIAPPTLAPTNPPPPPPAPPVRLTIPAIGLDLEPIAVGLDSQHIPIVPKHSVGWFNGSAMPGQNSNVVFWGHVLRWIDSPNIPAPFARMHELRPGAQIRVVTADGHVHRYRILRQVQVRPNQVSYVMPTPSERLTLVSCIGDSVIRAGTLTKEFRLITIAEPVG